MKAAEYNLTSRENRPIYQGATEVKTLTYRDPLGALINLTGMTAAMQVRKGANLEQLILDMSTANGKIALGGALGTITITFSKEDTAAMPAGSAQYDFYLINGSVKTKLFYGSIDIIQRVTL
jgi:hypothetical protein